MKGLADAPRQAFVPIFLAFAFTYFLSALLRAVTATLAPVFSAELGVGSAQLGLLAGAYFLGFAAMQLPVGWALDKHGPKETLLVLLAVAVLGCIAFALAGGYSALVGARLLIGVGVSACLMAPLTCFRRLFGPTAQLRANSWMLMSGSLGMVASTLPVQWLLPLTGWRGLFWVLAGLLVVASACVALLVPASRGAVDEPRVEALDKPHGAAAGYRLIFSHPTFIAMAPLGFFVYGGMIAVQALWAGPWLTRVCQWTPGQAAAGLFLINLSMLLAFLAWGAFMPRLVARGCQASGLIRKWLPLSLFLLAVNIVLGAEATAVSWGAWCVSCTVVALSQPAVGQAFPASLAGRALSAFNLVIFGGVFAIQWGIGLAIDLFAQSGLDTVAAFRGAFLLLWLCCSGAYTWSVASRASKAAR